jgi:hypothetical protein
MYINIYTCETEAGEERSAIPQSKSCGLSSSSSRIFPELKLWCTTAGKHISCKYLHNNNCHTNVIMELNGKDLQGTHDHFSFPSTLLMK